MKKIIPEIGTTRRRKGFLFFPKTINNIERWLEFAVWKEEFKVYNWQPIRWIWRMDSIQEDFCRKLGKLGGNTINSDIRADRNKIESLNSLMQNEIETPGIRELLLSSRFNMNYFTTIKRWS